PDETAFACDNGLPPIDLAGWKFAGQKHFSCRLMAAKVERDAQARRIASLGGRRLPDGRPRRVVEIIVSGPGFDLDLVDPVQWINQIHPYRDVDTPPSGEATWTSEGTSNSAIDDRV